MSSEESKLLSRAADYCSRSEHCVAEVADKLRQWGGDDQDVESVISRLLEEKFIDHRRYASFYVRDKFRFNGWGRQKVAYSLRMKRIESEVIGEALESIDDEEYIEKLRGLIEQKRKSVRGAEAYEQYAKLFRFAASRGFEPNVIKKVLGETGNSYD